MPFPWSKKSRSDDRVGVVGDDHLTGRRLRAPDALTPVHRPDSVRLIRHSRPLELSTAVDWELEICQWIDELAAREALDGGTYYVVDEMIRTRLAAELHLIDDEARAAASTERGLLRGVDQANLQLAALELEQLREQALVLRARIAVSEARLDGRPDPVDEGTPADPDASAALVLRPLPTAPDAEPSAPTAAPPAKPEDRDGEQQPGRTPTDPVLHDEPPPCADDRRNTR